MKYQCHMQLSTNLEHQTTPKQQTSWWQVTKPPQHPNNIIYTVCSCSYSATVLCHPIELPQPPIIQAPSIKEDLRVGFLQHANVTIVWELPKGSSARIHIYTIKFSTRTLGHIKIKDSCICHSVR